MPFKLLGQRRQERMLWKMARITARKAAGIATRASGDNVTVTVTVTVVLRLFLLTLILGDRMGAQRHSHDSAATTSQIQKQQRRAKGCKLYT
jgi:hypothetical protein